MTPYTKKDVQEAMEELSRELNTPLRLEAYSPGNRLGTRYRVYATSHPSPQLIAMCGTGPTVRVIWMATDVLIHYKHTQAHPATPIIEQLEDIEETHPIHEDRGLDLRYEREI